MACSSGLLQSGRLTGRHLRHRRVPAQLERPYVSHDRPPVAQAYLVPVLWHCPESVRDHGVQVPGRRAANSFGVEVGRLNEAAPRDHASSIADPPMARTAIDVEAFLPTRQKPFIDGNRDGGYKVAVRGPLLHRLI